MNRSTMLVLASAMTLFLGACGGETPTPRATEPTTVDTKATEQTEQPPAQVSEASQTQALVDANDPMNNMMPSNDVPADQSTDAMPDAVPAPDVAPDAPAQ